MRNFLRLLSTSAVLWTEMEKASDLLRSDTAFANALEPGAISPVVLQIGGSDPHELGAVATAARGRFAELNLNAGCPTVETGGADYGASLLRSPQTAAACLEAMAAAFDAPVSVKCRTAAFEGLDAGGGVPEAQYDTLASFVDSVTRAGCVDHVVVHARAAVLSGLSCSQNRQVPPLTPEYAVRLARDFPDLRVTLNGGIDSAEAVRRWSAPPLDGVMAGRWLLRRPLDLWALDQPADGAVGTAADAISRYTEYAQRPVLSDGDVRAVQPLALVAEQLRDDEAAGRDVDADVLGALREAAAVLDGRGGGGDGESLKKLSKRLGKMMGGSKVARKLTRNRAEQLGGGSAASRLIALRGGAMAAAPARLVVVGGGAAGFFGAIRAAEAAQGALEVTIYEASPRVLQKVRISGGGRCNVCHDETKDARLLAEGYPRGSRTLLGAFSRFGAPDVAAWFRGRGVELKTEEDGRMFPTTDSSESIVSALSEAAEAAGVVVRPRHRVAAIDVVDAGEAEGGERFALRVAHGDGEEVVRCRSVLLASGGTRDGHKLAERLGLPLVNPVPSLFTLTLAPNPVSADLAGVTVPEVELTLVPPPPPPPPAAAADDAGAPAPRKRKRRRGAPALSTRGPLLFTHSGLTGPATLRLSSFGARVLAECGYKAAVKVSWAPGLTEEGALDACRDAAARAPKKRVGGYSPIALPRRLWQNIAAAADVPDETTWAECSKKRLHALARGCVATRLEVVGKGTFKDEFVTAGGAALEEVSTRFESRSVAGLFLAGEVLDIDGITGGYNFQNAWTSSWCAGSAIAEDAAALAEEGTARRDG